MIASVLTSVTTLETMSDDGAGDGPLRADHVVVQARHQLAGLGVGEEAQRHALHVAEQGARAGRR